jgi:hypothetical protein
LATPLAVSRRDKHQAVVKPQANFTHRRATTVNQRIAIVFTLTALVANSAFAAAPELKSLLPAGAQRGQTVEVTISGSLGTPPVRGWCSREDVTITVPEKGSKFTVQVAADSQPGLCWIRLTNAEGASALRPFVIGTLTELLDKEPNNELAKAQQLPSSQVVVHGALAKAGDVDIFAVPLKKGETLVASIDANVLLGSPMDALLQVVSPAGFVLQQNDDTHGFDPQLAFTATTAGTHFVRMFAFPSKPNSTIRLAGGADYIYRLTLTTGPFVDHAFPSSVTRGEDRSVELHGWNLSDSLRRFSIPVTGNADTVRVYHAQLANTLELRVDEHPSISEPQQDDIDKPVEITLPVTVTGRIEPAGDVDVFAFDAKKGERLAFRIDSRLLGQALDATIELRDANGKVLKRVDDPKKGIFDPTLDYTIPKEGRYLLAVSDLFGHGGLRYAYRLTIAPQTPTFRLSTAADTFKLTAGMPLKIPVTVTRERGFADDIEITATDLPEGVFVIAVTSVTQDKDTAKKVELILTAAEDVTIDGRLQIVGTPTGDDNRIRTATAPITGLTATTSDLWLTVLKPATKKK